jgi:hypothetical protein
VLWAIGGILSSWLLFALVIAGNSEWDVLTWMASARLARIVPMLVVAGAAAFLAGGIAGSRPRATVVAIALGFLWACQVEAWLTSVRAATSNLGDVSAIWATYHYMLARYSVIAAACAAATGVGWLTRAHGGLAGASIGVLTLGRHLSVAAADLPWVLFIGGAVAGAIGGLLGQELVRGFVSWRQRSAAPWPLIAKAGLMSAGLTPFMSLPYGCLWVVAATVSAPNLAPYWVHMAATIAGLLLFGGAVGRLLSHSWKLATALAAAATAIQYVLSGHLATLSQVRGDAMGVAVAAIGAFAVARAHARRAAMKAIPAQTSEAAGAPADHA